MAGLVFGPVFGPVFGLGSGLAFGLVFGLSSAIAPARGMRNISGLTRGLVAGLMGRLMFGLAFGLMFGLGSGLWSGLVFGLVSGLLFWLRDLAAVPADLAGAMSPRAVLARDRQEALLMSGAGLVFGLVFGLVVGLRSGPVAGLMFGPVAGLMTGLGLSMRETAWPSYVLTRGRLGADRRRAVVADELSRRRPPARRTPAGRRGLPVPAHRTAASTRDPAVNKVQAGTPPTASRPASTGPAK